MFLVGMEFAVENVAMVLVEGSGTTSERMSPKVLAKDYGTEEEESTISSILLALWWTDLLFTFFLSCRDCF
jgi:hypothetical protein